MDLALGCGHLCGPERGQGILIGGRFCERGILAGAARVGVLPIDRIGVVGSLDCLGLDRLDFSFQSLDVRGEVELRQGGAGVAA